MTLPINGLPVTDLAAVGATAACDPEPSQANLDAGETTLFCSDGLTLALRAFRAVTSDPIERIYLRRPKCATLPCSEADLSTAEVVGWTEAEVLAVQLDSRLDAVVRPTVIAEGHWPDAGGAVSPTVRREPITGAPSEVANRKPFPFCGRAEIGEPAPVLECFRDAVLAGRPAEAVERVFGTEGGEILWLFRYGAKGPIVRYQRDGDRWRRNAGSMILGFTPQAWDFDPWSGAEQGL